ncbi:TraB/GumN family protein [Candidatus Woesearchaeota archaeon]|nr:TraB/GumN family protein [Candidatus Woesearchaeota archaeon]
MDNFRVVGTSHISADSIKVIERSFDEFMPEIVAVELDRGRLHALMSGVKAAPSLSDIRRIGLGGFLFLVIGSFLQARLGEHVGIVPGSDMRKAVLLARERNIPVALIDRDIAITMRRFSRYFTFREKFRLFADVLLSPFSKRVKVDLSKVPDRELISLLMGELRSKYPGIYRVLVEERNVHMAEALARIMAANPDKRVLAVVGAGHEDEVLRLVLEKKR